MAYFAKLFEPGRIGELELKNRTIFPPIVTRYVGRDGSITQQQIDYYAERAKGGCALIIVEATYPRSGGYPGRISLDNDKALPGLQRLVDRVHAEGARIILQVNPHRGRADEMDCASASENVDPKTGKKARMLTRDDFRRLEEAFGQGSRRAQEAGFDGIMVHGGSGYLVSETLSPLANRRTDEYGGNTERRARFALNLVTAAKSSTADDYPVTFRMTADEKIPGGFAIQEAITVARLLERAGCDAIDVVSGINYVNFVTDVIGHMYTPRGHNVDLAMAIKKRVGIPVCVAGRINDPFLAEKILADGGADFIDLGRGLVADPFFVNKAKSGNTDDICKCIACGRCVEAIFANPPGPMVCSVNPAVGKEREFSSGMLPAKSKKRVLVIGGGPGGIEAAVRCSQRGHEVTLWEKESQVGGQLNTAFLPPGKGEIKNLLEVLRHRLINEKVTVKLGKEGDAASIVEMSADAVVVACGPERPITQVAGVPGRQPLHFADVLTGKALVGHKVVVLGGGSLACETAEFLAEKGKSVTLVGRRSSLADDIHPFYADLLTRRLDKVKVHLGVKEQQVNPTGVSIVCQDGRRLQIDAEDIVIATGYKPNQVLFEELSGKVRELYEVGDCHKPARIYEAIYSGAVVGMRI